MQLMQALFSPAWKINNGEASRELKFPDKETSNAFLTGIAAGGQTYDHGLDRTVWKDGVLTVWTTTPDAGNTLTGLDLKLAGLIDWFYSQQYLA